MDHKQSPATGAQRKALLRDAARRRPQLSSFRPENVPAPGVGPAPARLCAPSVQPTAEPVVTPPPLVLACEPPGVVFVSYCHKDKRLVVPFVKRLRDHGIHVAWDEDFMCGADFRQLITSAIDAARCVIVVWSAASVQSACVIGEATRARLRSSLLPVFIDGFDLAVIPIDFTHIHAVPLRDFKKIAAALEARGAGALASSPR